MGPDDTVEIPAEAEELSTEVQLVASKMRFDLGIGRALDDMARSGIYPTEIGLDLLVLAALVHGADTRISRTSESQDSWTREIRLVVPVSDVPKWSETVGLLQRMLNFLTGDLWTVAFRMRPIRFATAVRSRPNGLPPLRYTELSLFSGGLDSLIGSIDLLERGRIPLLISHAGEGSTSDAQNKLYEALRKQYADIALARQRIWMSFRQRLVSGSGGENTTRGRSFLFFAFGLTVGSGVGGEFTLLVPENGLIALNIPLDPLRLGSNSTRTTHPFYMGCWNKLAGLLGITAHIRNPYWDRTKGEMVAECANRALLISLVPKSMSCSSPSKGRWKKKGVEHCGYCLPCLIRRAAIRRGLEKDDTTYTLADLSSHMLDTRKAEGQQVRSFQLAIARLQAKPNLAPLLIHKSGPLIDQTTEQQKALAGVYSRGLNEVGMVLENVQTHPV